MSYLVYKRLEETILWEAGETTLVEALNYIYTLVKHTFNNKNRSRKNLKRVTSSKQEMSYLLKVKWWGILLCAKPCQNMWQERQSKYRLTRPFVPCQTNDALTRTSSLDSIRSPYWFFLSSPIHLSPEPILFQTYLVYT